MKTSDKEMQAVMLLDGPARYQHFVKRVVDNETAWGLWKNGWALMKDDSGRGVFPLWPAREYADAARTSDWDDYVPQEIDLADLLGDLLPKLSASGVVPGVFPTPQAKAITPTVDELVQALRDEMKRYGE